MKLKHLFIFVPLLFFGCQKKSATTNPPATTTSSTPNTVFFPYNALFLINKNVRFWSGTPSIDTSYTAYMFSQTNLTTVVFLDMGNVRLGNIVLYQDKSMNYYQDTTFIKIHPPYVWSVSGSTNIAAFNFTQNLAFPIWSDFNIIPDSVSIKAGFTISLNGLQGCDGIQLSIYGSSTSTFSPKVIPGNSANITITPSDLSKEKTGGGDCTIQFYKDNIQTINGKKLNFRSNLTIEKSIKMVN